MTLKELLNTVYFGGTVPVLFENRSLLIDGVVYENFLDIPEDVQAFTVDAIYHTPEFLRIDLC